MDVSKKKFGMNIILPSSDETGELRLTFDTVSVLLVVFFFDHTHLLPLPVKGEEYASWMAGCRMVMKGKPLSKHGYEQELQSIKGFIALQNKSDGGSAPRSDVSGCGYLCCSVGVVTCAVVWVWLPVCRDWL